MNPRTSAPSARRLAILYPGDRAMRDAADLSASRYASLFAALQAAGVATEAAVYHDDFADEVERQLRRVRAVLVWHNPIEGGRTRQRLDQMLARVAASGVFVSAHPDTILRLGTKDVLVAVKELTFGSDAHRVGDLEQLSAELPRRLRAGPRVLKQHRGHSGIGVWRVEQVGEDRFALRHAQRGSIEDIVDFATVVRRLSPYFADGGHMIDQAWQPGIVDGMVRAYLVRDRVAGFGHQAINALYPAGSDGQIAPPPGPRLYSGPDDARFQDLRSRLDRDWVGLLLQATGVARDALPLLWDADFMLGPSRADGSTGYVLCEINLSSVAPFPPSAVEPIVAAARAILLD